MAYPAYTEVKDCRRLQAIFNYESDGNISLACMMSDWLSIYVRLISTITARSIGLPCSYRISYGVPVKLEGVWPPLPLKRSLTDSFKTNSTLLSRGEGNAYQRGQNML